MDVEFGVPLVSKVYRDINSALSEAYKWLYDSIDIGLGCNLDEEFDKNDFEELINTGEITVEVFSLYCNSHNESEDVYYEFTIGDGLEIFDRIIIVQSEICDE